ncbi:prolyl-tRNA synthetase associated domain-containing protein [Streptococcus ovuberis]|uniref:Prolyl-tRNA synthetase associated domain-containing protein n=1 Tax=Streptococcus ovuberis TaxID=1936207 RepID=A0A7X6S199_9STRE|nr:prolyl-tRNA synthetase associated domain-containing protein [Streptococcus ovuberis]NKZ21033.1 prolyl-tRNA synthetase associated domain-containing protein [Streptococcus ovuberis]
MSPYQIVMECLGRLGIDIELVEHPPAYTTEEADRYIKGIPGVRTKSMFLTNKKKTAYYLIIMDDQKRLDMEKLTELLETTRLRMASANSLKEKLGIAPGSVSIFGLLNNRERDVQVLLDKAILSEDRMSFHPNDNTKTVFLSTADMLRFIDDLGYAYQMIDV